MSARIQQYWKELRALEESLPEFVWLVGIDDGPGAVTQAAASIAAKFLHAKSHRVATDEEVAAQRANDAVARTQAKHERMRRSGAAVVVLGPDQADAPTAPPALRRRR